MFTGQPYFYLETHCGARVCASGRGAHLRGILVTCKTKFDTTFNYRYLGRERSGSVLIVELSQ